MGMQTLAQSNLTLYHDLATVTRLDLDPVEQRTLHDLYVGMQCYDAIARPGQHLSVSVHTSSNSDRAWDAKPTACVDVSYRSGDQRRPLVNSASLRTAATLISALGTVIEADLTRTQQN